LQNPLNGGSLFFSGKWEQFGERVKNNGQQSLAVWCQQKRSTLPAARQAAGAY